MFVNLIRPAPPPAQTCTPFAARALEPKTLCDFCALEGTAPTRRPPRHHPPLTRPTGFASWPLSRVGNPRGLRDALAATRTDRATAHGSQAADQTALQATGSCWLVGLSGGRFPAFRQPSAFGAEERRTSFYFRSSASNIGPKIGRKTGGTSFSRMRRGSSKKGRGSSMFRLRRTKNLSLFPNFDLCSQKYEETPIFHLVGRNTEESLRPCPSSSDPHPSNPHRVLSAPLGSQPSARCPTLKQSHFLGVSVGRG